MNHFFLLLVQSAWFSLPMYVSNMMPVMVKRFPCLDVPIDMGKTWKGKPIFGSHKTVRGFLFGTTSAMVVALVQKGLFMQGGVWETISIFDYAHASAIVLGGLLGFGALAGDAIESFFKRRVGIEPGKPWFIFDQIDYAIGALAVVSPIFVPSVSHIVVIISLGIVGSFVSSFVGFHVGLKESEV